MNELMTFAKRAGVAVLLSGAALSLAACDALGFGSEPTHRFTLAAKPEDARVRPEVSQAPLAALVAESLPIIEGRLEASGINVHAAQQQGADRIVLDLSGADLDAGVAAMTGSGVALELMLVDRKVPPQVLVSGVAPAGALIVRVADGSPDLAVLLADAISGKHILSARSGRNPFTDEVVIDIAFDRVGAEQLAELTTAHVGREMAIIVDGVALAAPVINEPVVRGEIQISQGLSQEEASELAGALQSGSLPMPFEIVGEEELRAE